MRNLVVVLVAAIALSIVNRAEASFGDLGWRFPDSHIMISSPTLQAPATAYTHHDALDEYSDFTFTTYVTVGTSQLCVHTTSTRTTHTWQDANIQLSTGTLHEVYVGGTGRVWVQFSWPF